MWGLRLRVLQDSRAAHLDAGERDALLRVYHEYLVEKVRDIVRQVAVLGMPIVRCTKGILT